mgnify:CR=1 FL=1
MTAENSLEQRIPESLQPFLERSYLGWQGAVLELGTQPDRILLTCSLSTDEKELFALLQITRSNTEIIIPFVVNNHPYDDIHPLLTEMAAENRTQLSSLQSAAEQPQHSGIHLKGKTPELVTITGSHHNIACSFNLSRKFKRKKDSEISNIDIDQRINYFKQRYGIQFTPLHPKND